MLHRVCRAYGQSPDTVRTWEWPDYMDALQGLGEMPWVDDLLNSFMGGSKDDKSGGMISISDPASRAEWLKLAEKAEKP